MYWAENGGRAFGSSFLSSGTNENCEIHRTSFQRSLLLTQKRAGSARVVEIGFVFALHLQFERRTANAARMDAPWRQLNVKEFYVAVPMRLINLIRG